MVKSLHFEWKAVGFLFGSYRQIKDRNPPNPFRVIGQIVIGQNVDKPLQAPVNSNRFNLFRELEGE